MNEPAAPPAPARPPPLPEAVYRWMAGALRIGLFVGLALMLAALAVYLAQHPGTSFAGALGSNPLPGLLAPGAFASALLAGRPDAYLTLGVLVLIATPAVRVLTGLLYFRRNGERAMSAITLTVLALVVVGLVVLGPLLR